jgi:hypothetical protein
MNDYLKAQIQEHCYMVERGKPMSILSYQERYHNELAEIVKEAGLLVKCVIDKEWGVAYIFKNPALRYVIEELPCEPETASEHYLLGALCGYDNNSICDFIFKNQFKHG